MDYQQTIEYLYSKLPMFSKIGAKAVHKSLDNILKLCEATGHPEKKIKTIHVAGTNGKGSVSNMLSSVFTQCGYKTGLYTSPHLFDFRERIKIDGKMCSKEFVVDFVEKSFDLIEEIKPSFFEITVAMAFEYFGLNRVDIAIVETGLGGRLDSTNIIQPELSIITNIGLDHTDMLGNSLPEIAFEKAGIIKEKTPVVIGEWHAETENVFKNKAKQMQSEIFFAEKNIQVLAHDWSDGFLNMVILDEGKEEKISTDLCGQYQLKNIVTVVQALKILKASGWNVTRQNVLTALKNVSNLTGFRGRWQQLQKNPDVIADVAHNVDGIKSLTEQIKNHRFKNLHIILGMVKDKDVEAVLKLLPKNANYYFTAAHIPRALPKEELKLMAEKLKRNGDGFDHVDAAIDAALQHASPEDLIVICGSVFLIAEIKSLNINAENNKY